MSVIQAKTIKDILSGALLNISDLADLVSSSAKTLANYAALRAYTGGSDTVCITQSGMSGVFKRLSGSSLTDNGGTIIVDGAGRVWLREYSNDVMATWFGVVPSNSSPAIAKSNAEAINLACDFVGAQFPGRVILPRGTIYLTDTNPTAGSWDNNRAIYLRYDAIEIYGQGIGVTILKLIDNANCTVIKVGSYVENTVVARRCVIGNMQIDGSRATQKTPTTTLDHFSGIAVSNNCEYTVLQDLYVTDTPYYGIGIGQDGLSNCKVYRVETNRTGGDGLDWKNNSNNQTGGIIDGFKARNFGLLPLANVLTPQAGLDMRSGIHATNIDISEMTGPSGLIGIRIQIGTAGETLAQPTTIDKFKVVGTNASDSNGVRVISRGSVVSNGRVNACSDGVSLSNLDCRMSDIIAESNNVGFRLWGTADPSIEADTGTHSGLMARSNSQAGIVCDSVDEITFIGADVRNNGIGYDIRTGCTNIRIIGGSCSGNTTPLSDLGTGTVVTSVSSFRTRQKLSTNLPIDSTGVKSLTFNHTLAVTPDITDVQLTLNRDPSYNLGDFQVVNLWVTGTTSSTITAQARVAAASATVGAVCKVIADVSAKSTI